MTVTELDDPVLGDKLKRDAFGDGEPGEYEELRHPENIDRTLAAAKVLLAKLNSQMDIIKNRRTVGQEIGQEIDPEWFLKLANLRDRMTPRVVEFEELAKRYEARSIRQAIERHRTAAMAADCEPEPYDLELWRHAG